jgi:hypothetical protein
VYAQDVQFERLEHREVSRTGMAEFQPSCLLKNPSSHLFDRVWAWTDPFYNDAENVIIIPNRWQQH